MALLKMVPKEGVSLDNVKIDRENIGQLASLLVAALTSKSTRFKLRSQDVANSLRTGATWSQDAVLVGIQDFIILSETGAKIRTPFHIDLLKEVCLSQTTLKGMDEVSLIMTVAHYTRVTLTMALHNYNQSTIPTENISARQFIRRLIDDAIAMVFIKGVENV